MLGNAWASLRIIPKPLFAFEISPLIWVLNFNFSPRCIRRCFWLEVWATGDSLKKIVGWFRIVYLQEKMASCACLFISGLIKIFQWKARSNIFLRSSFKKFAHSVAFHTVENNEVSSTNNFADYFKFSGGSLM